LADRGWQRPFDDPIPLPDGRQLVTLGDAAKYIQGLPEADHELEEWQAAVEALLLVVKHNGPTMFARIGMMRALYPKETATQAPRRERANAYRIIR
jgi:hypothetical protein